MPHLVATALAGAALAVLPIIAAAPAGASTLPAPAAAASELRLTLTYPGDDASGTRTVTLTCAPDGGGHPAARRACAELGARGGAIEGEPADTACVLIYAPVVAEVTGHWQGTPVRFSRKYGNDCELHARTGTVFRF
ncbi:SSI family serine proteinase inhibitor [Spirillospora sp. NPDC047279]|uniref:SSI family serine proteinase inhibitor n=1 Tax=Spirillospora sp. NPDC047279 TaxID=3155478 RepID=UPI0033E9E077